MRLAIALVILLAASSCEALELKDVTFNYYPSGSLKFKYTGIKKVIIDEVRDTLEDEWRSDAETLFNSGQISLSQYRYSLLRLSWTRQHYGMNGYWWERPWYESRPPNKGGAPRPQSFTIGRTGDFIDLGFARVNENFKFKFKEYSTDITRNWKFKFRPHVTGNTNDIISTATVSFVFIYSSIGRRRFRFTIQTGYRKRLNEFVEFRIEMFNL